MKLFDRFVKGDMHGIHYAASIFVATALLWVLVREIFHSDPIWAVSSMVATSDPLMKQAVLIFRARLINTLLGCATALLFIAIGGTRIIMLPVAMAVTVLLSSYVVRIQTMWRQAPITAAIVIAAGFEHRSRVIGFESAMKRVGEVLFGCIMGLVVAWVFSKIWPLPDPPPAAEAKRA
jgi:uncharacterized membrane protein YccC